MAFSSAALDPVLGALIQAEWLDTRAAAARLGFTVGTMQTYRWMRTGPGFRKVGRRVVYASEVVDAWAAALLAAVAKYDRTDLVATALGMLQASLANEQHGRCAASTAMTPIFW